MHESMGYFLCLSMAAVLGIYVCNKLRKRNLCGVDGKRVVYLFLVLIVGAGLIVNGEASSRDAFDLSRLLRTPARGFRKRTAKPIGTMAYVVTDIRTDIGASGADLLRHRRGRRSEAALLVGLAVAVAILFAATSLDIEAARVFYRASGPNHWPLAEVLPWSILYGLAPVITAALILIGLAGVVAGYVLRRAAWRSYALFLALTVVIGPGLIINAVFKDHWDRPRPRDLVEFGGPLHYVPAPLPGEEGGKSFPCGHCSVGFLVGAGWWVWRHRRPMWARTSLTVGVITGLALGLGRMAAGGHFLSDVIWSAILAFGVAHVLYYYILCIPGFEAHVNGAPRIGALGTPRRQRITTVLATLGAAGVLLAVFVTPHGRPFAIDVDLAAYSPPPGALEVTARTANVTLVITDVPSHILLAQGELHGFGPPASVLDVTAGFRATPSPTLLLAIVQTGWIADLDASVTLHVPAGDLNRIRIRLERGNIQVIDLTRTQVVERGDLTLDLRTVRGHIQHPPPDHNSGGDETQLRPLN